MNWWFCMNRSPELELTLYHMEEQNKPPTQIWISVYGSSAFSICQFSCYLALFRHLFQHDRMVKSVLPEGVLQSRTRRNAINLAGHVATFTIECSIRVFMTIGHHWFTTDGQFVGMVIFLNNYSSIGMIKIGMSPDLRREFLHMASTTLGFNFRNQIQNTHGSSRESKSHQPKIIRVKPIA